MEIKELFQMFVIFLPEAKTRYQCWDLDKRGTVGDTILHLCLLNATQIHADLAKRLLHFYPNLIKDIYSGEEYYGRRVAGRPNLGPKWVKLLSKWTNPRIFKMRF